MGRKGGRFRRGPEGPGARVSQPLDPSPRLWEERGRCGRPEWPRDPERRGSGPSKPNYRRREALRGKIEARGSIPKRSHTCFPFGRDGDFLLPKQRGRRSRRGPILSAPEAAPPFRRVVHRVDAARLDGDPGVRNDGAARPADVVVAR